MLGVQAMGQRVYGATAVCEEAWPTLSIGTFVSR